MASQKKSPSLFPLLTVNFIGTLGFSIVLPFLVHLTTEYGGNEFIYGLVGATYSIFQFVGAPILGNLSDRVGRRKILFVSQLGTLFSWLIFLFAISLPATRLMSFDSAWTGSFLLTLPLVFLFVARALDGLTGGNISVANAYLVDISTEQNQKVNFGKMAASSNLGFILGPAIGGVLSATALGTTLPVLVAILISTIALPLIWFLPESNPQPMEKSPDPSLHRRVMGKENKDCFKPKEKGQFWLVLGLPRLKSMLLMYFFIFLAFNFFYTAFPIHSIKALEWSPSRLGFYFSVLSGLMVLVQGPVMSKLGTRFKEKQLVSVGSLLMMFCFVFLLSSQVMWVYASAVFFALGNGIMWPSFLSMLGKIGDKKQQGYIQGIATSCGSLASIIGLIGGGMLYSSVGVSTFVVAASIFVVVFFMNLFFCK